MTDRRIPHRVAAALVLAAAALALPPAAAQPAFNQYVVTPYWSAGSTNPRALMRDDLGRIWVGSGDGVIRILEDFDQNGTVDNVKIFVAGTFSPHGLAWRPNGGGRDIYVAHLTAPFGGTGQITRFIDANGDDVFESVVSVVLSLPTGAHQVNNIKFDSTYTWLYIAQGATGDSSPGGGALIARVDSFAQNLIWGSPSIEIHATGLRNAWGIEFHPSGALFATDNGRDDQGADTPPDEFNHIVQGGNYGFPAYGGTPPPGSGTLGPAGLLEAHVSANGFTIDQDLGMTGFVNQVFIAEWGSWPGITPSPRGQKIVQGNLHQDSGGTWHLFTRDFLNDCGRPLDVESGLQGDIFFTVQQATPNWPVGVYRVASASGISVKLQGTPEAGQQLAAVVRSPSRPGHVYQLGASLGTGPIPTTAGNLGLSPDTLLFYSLMPNPYFVFTPLGILGPTGTSNGADVINLPAIGGLSGFTFYVAAITLDPVTGAFSAVSPTATVIVL